MSQTTIWLEISHHAAFRVGGWAFVRRGPDGGLAGYAGGERRIEAERTALAALIAALKDLDSELTKLPADADGEAIQHLVFEVGKRHPFESLRHWFQALYETLLGSSQGPRIGSFIALYGIDNSRRLIAEALAS